MEDKSIFSIRLKNARIMKGLSMDDLCKKMDNRVTKTTISKYENGIMEPGDEILKLFASVLNQSVEYFHRPISVHIDSVDFRKKSSLGTKQIDAIKEIVADKVERYIQIEEICNEFKHVVSLPVYVVSCRDDVITAAETLRADWKLGEDGISNVIELLEEKGIKIVEVDAPLAFDGLGSKVNNLYPVIVLNKKCKSERKRFNALHELGHLVLNFSESVDAKKRESLCHLFASEMLISTKELKRILGVERKKVSYKEIIPLQLRYGISYDALMFKANECGIISGQCFRWFNIHKNQDPGYKDFVQQNRYANEESSRFDGLVHRALYSDLIDIAKAASLLCISTDKLRSEFAMA